MPVSVRTHVFALAVCAALPGIAAQSMRVVPPSDLAVQRAQMEKEAEALRHVEEGLESKLFREDPKLVTQQIDRTVVKVRALGEARRAYNLLLIGQVREQLRSLEAYPSPDKFRGPLDDLRSSAERRVSELAAVEEQLSAELRNYAVQDSDKDAAMEELLRARLQNVAKMRENLKKQVELSDRGQILASDPARREAMEHTRQVLSALQTEAAKSDEETELWLGYFISLRSIVAENGARHKNRPEPRRPDQPAPTKKKDKP